MNRHILVWTLATVFLTTVSLSHAQQPAKIPRIGFLSTASLASLSARLNAFRQGLRDLGYIEGKNIIIEHRSADGNPDRLPELAVELVRLKVDCFVTAGASPTRATMLAAGSIPIIATTLGDPVAAGIVASLARPGGNVTGLSSLSSDLAGKRLELLKETIPRLSRVAIFGDGRGDGPTAFKETETAARLLKVQVISLEAQSLDELENGFRSMVKGRADAFINGSSGFFTTHQQRTIELAAQYRLPANV